MRTYVLGLAKEAASLKGVWILFVIVTAALVVDSVETEINAIWRITRKRPIMRRVILYTIGVTAGPVLLGAAIMLIRWLLRHSVAIVTSQPSTLRATLVPVPFVLAAVGFTLLYAIAPARRSRGGTGSSAAFSRRRRSSDAPRLRVVRREFADLRDPVRRAGRGSDVHAVGVRVLDDRARGRRRYRVARGGGWGKSGTATSSTRRCTDPLSCRIEARRLHSGRHFVRSKSNVWSIIQAAGWPIWPLIVASIIALALIFERLWSLRTSVVAPPGMVDRVLAEFRQRRHARAPRQDAAQGPLGRILAAGLANVKAPRPVMKEAIEEVGRVVTHDLDRFLTTLGTIAAMSPLLGLLGTVIGMIEIFGSQTPPRRTRSSSRTASRSRSTTRRWASSSRFRR